MFKDDSAQTAAKAIGVAIIPSSPTTQPSPTQPSPGHHESLLVAHTSVVKKTVATNLRRARKRAGLSQAALAQHAGIDKGTISRIERAESDTVVTKLYVFAFALSVPVSDLLAGLPEP